MPSTGSCFLSSSLQCVPGMGRAAETMHILLVCQEAISGPWECFVLHLVVCQEAIIRQAMRVLRAALGCLMKINPVHQLLFDLFFVMRPLMETWPDGLVSVISPFICQDQCVLYARGNAVGLGGDQVRTMASAEGWGVEWADAPGTRSVVSSEEGAADGGRSVRWQRMDRAMRRRVDEGLVGSSGSSDEAMPLMMYQKPSQFPSLPDVATFAE
ncbi:hypothetical protein HD553DRAFT_327103 [Filobasidium floriforme]|uniref:uncharacterized protein n=1 Tax=Filobasidium floriforme TaxID=5210 RepID=UPI001E8CBD5D|nr:uncharacterized protein HD553DRAFT_327103 [Filobasidium floriforme]KAH8078029.1 hypothetical protein HD553DRAFT_327103 [Filobasidium floriforme]